MFNGLELSVEISEEKRTLDEIINAVQIEYPGFRFDRTEQRYQTCIMAVFIKD